MCEQCYCDAGSPDIDNQAVRTAVTLIEAVYAEPKGGVGGYLHIVVDDYNVGRHSIEFCLQYLEDDPHEYGAESVAINRLCAEHLLTMTEAEVMSAVHKVDVNEAEEYNNG